MSKTLDKALREAAKKLEPNRDWESAQPSHFMSVEDRLSAALRAIDAAGWVLVPREATQEMIDAGVAPRGYTSDGYPNTHHLTDKWRVMLAAAPKLEDKS